MISDDVSLANDICLLMLSQPVDISEDDANVICIPSKYEKYDEDNCVIAGWGKEGKLEDVGPFTATYSNILSISI